MNNQKKPQPPFGDVDFGVCIRDRKERNYFRVPVEQEVTDVLRMALASTLDKLGATEADFESIKDWEASEKHSTIDPCKLSLKDGMLSLIRNLTDADDFEDSSSVLGDNPNDVFYYFVRFKQGNRCLWGLRKANQFKANLKATVAMWDSGELKLSKANTFRIDDFFDLVVVGDNVYVLRPNDFEYIADLEKQLRIAAKERLIEANLAMPFFKLDDLVTAVSKDCSMQRARLATAVATRDDLEKTDKELFASACERVGIEIKEVDGVYTADEDNSWLVLKLLDRRRFATDLIVSQHEIYEAPSRYAVNGK